jgi:cytochrome P450
MPPAYHTHAQPSPRPYKIRSATPTEAAGRLAAISSLLQELIEHKRATPGDDLTSDFIREADLSDTTLTAKQLHDQLMLLIAAGIETTVHGIGNLLVNLMTHPAELHKVLSGEAAWEDACEESLRYRGPVGAVPLRFIVNNFIDPDTGESFTRGEPVLIHFGAAGRDPGAHGHSADRFDVSRKQAPHLAFGAGPHFCPGAPLARKEITTAGARWFARFPHSELAVGASELRYLPSWIISGYRQIPVRLRPGASRAA